MPFNEQLQRLRRAGGLSQEELAARIGVSRQAVSKWEVGEAAPDLGNLLALADALGVSLDALCGRDDEAERPAPPEKSTPRRRVWPYLLAALAGVVLHTLLLLLALNLHAGDIHLGSRTISVSTPHTAPAPTDDLLGNPTDNPAPSPVVPDALRASNIMFAASGGETVCTFCTDVMDEGWTCEVTFVPEGVPGADVTAEAELVGSFWRAAAPLDQSVSYSVTARINDGIATRAVPLARGLTRSASGASWVSAEN